MFAAVFIYALGIGLLISGFFLSDGLSDPQAFGDFPRLIAKFLI
jgi:hypothetical protein